MGTTLTGTTPQDTYDSLIKVTDNGPLSATAKYLSDGLGNDSILALSTTAVGIGTTSPNVESGYGVLTFNGSTGGILDIKAAGTNVFRMYGTASASMVRTVTATPLLLGTTDLERMRIDSAGNVGIGTSAPENIGAGITHVAVSGSTTGVLSIQSGATRILSLATSGTNAVIQNRSTGSIVFAVNAGANEICAVTSNGLTFNGDTAAANALDDYEEGTWTMGISFGGASVGVTTTANTGTYTKIGRQVTVNGYLKLSSKGSSTGIAFLTGLPFTVGNTAANFGAASLWFDVISYANQFQGRFNQNLNYIELEEITILGVTSNLTNADFADSSGIMVSATYFV